MMSTQKYSKEWFYITIGISIPLVLIAILTLATFLTMAIHKSATVEAIRDKYHYQFKKSDLSTENQIMFDKLMSGNIDNFGLFDRSYQFNFFFCPSTDRIKIFDYDDQYGVFSDRKITKNNTTFRNEQLSMCLSYLILNRAKLSYKALGFPNDVPRDEVTKQIMDNL